MTVGATCGHAVFSHLLPARWLEQAWSMRATSVQTWAATQQTDAVRASGQSGERVRVQRSADCPAEGCWLTWGAAAHRGWGPRTRGDLAVVGWAWVPFRLCPRITADWWPCRMASACQRQRRSGAAPPALPLARTTLLMKRAPSPSSPPPTAAIRGRSRPPSASRRTAACTGAPPAVGASPAASVCIHGLHVLT